MFAERIGPRFDWFKSYPSRAHTPFRGYISVCHLFCAPVARCIGSRSDRPGKDVFRAENAWGWENACSPNALLADGDLVVEGFGQQRSRHGGFEPFHVLQSQVLDEPSLW